MGADLEMLRDVRIPTAEPGVTLSGDVWLPVTEAPVPVLVMALPYRKDAGAGVQADASFRWLANRGYASLLVDVRGTGSSDGTMRPPLAADEADDGVAAIEWAARQPWCSGNVGMWGLSYGSVMTMRTASRSPESLKAIIPIMGPLDPERDLVHPHGARGGQLPIPIWSATNLMNQLLPPLHNFHSADEQRRWHQRLHETEPWFVDLLRHCPGDPAWRERAIDASAIEVPSLCVAGWRDVFLEGQIRAYERFQGPKKLLVGPWMHSLPHDSPFERIDFLSLALRWWDHWLRGIDTGIMREPPVTVYVQGTSPGWRAYDAWPPGHGELALGTREDTTLNELEPGVGDGSTVIAEYRSDPTLGALSGLWALAGATFGMPLDQHEDDSRAVSATSEPLSEAVLIVGRPKVTVAVATDASAAIERLVVRLCDVDPAGRSTFVTSGVAVGSQQVTLYPTAHRVRAGHRLRVAVSDSDFPRLWPLSDAPSLQIAGIEVRVPTVPEDVGAPVDVPALEQPSPDAETLGLWAEPRWQITRDPVHGGVEVVWGAALASYTVCREHLLEVRQECCATVRADKPEATVMSGAVTYAARMQTGEAIDVAVTVRMMQSAVWARGEIDVDGTTIFSRIWDLALAPCPDVAPTNLGEHA